MQGTVPTVHGDVEKTVRLRIAFVSRLPRPRGMVPAPSPYQDIIHRPRHRDSPTLFNHPRLRTFPRTAWMWVLFTGIARPTPKGGSGIDVVVRRECSAVVAKRQA